MRKTLREDNFFKQLINRVKTCAAHNNFEMPPPSRTSKTPARIRSSTQPEAVVPDSGEAQWRLHFIEAVDIVEAELSRRFDQAGMKVAAQSETTLPKTFNRSSLQMQLTLLSDMTKDNIFRSVPDVAEFISALHPQTRGLFKEVEAFIELCLFLPVSAAPSETSFSSLRRLKTWMRSTMSRKRLTHLAVMHIHSHILDRVDVPSLVRSKATFGAM